MKYFAHKLFFALITWCSYAMAGEISNQGAIMTVGTFHGGEVPDIPGHGWLALISNDQTAELRSVKPRIRTVFDPVGDDPNDKAHFSGKEVVVKGLRPLLLIQVDGLVAGKISQGQITDETHGQAIDLKGTIYHVVHRCKPRDPKSGFAACKVYLTGNGNSQWLDDTSENEDSDFTLTLRVLWAGDIDRDGKIDLILEKSSYNNNETILMLSSAAAKKQMLAPVASLAQQGC